MPVNPDFVTRGIGGTMTPLGQSRMNRSMPGTIGANPPAPRPVDPNTGMAYLSEAPPPGAPPSPIRAMGGRLGGQPTPSRPAHLGRPAGMEFAGTPSGPMGWSPDRGLFRAGNPEPGQGARDHWQRIQALAAGGALRDPMAAFKQNPNVAPPPPQQGNPGVTAPPSNPFGGTIGAGKGMFGGGSFGGGGVPRPAAPVLNLRG